MWNGRFKSWQRKARNWRRDMTDPLSKLRTIINHRADVARRWFGLREAEQTAQFVYDDPDVQALLNNPVVAKAMFREGMLAVIGDVWDGNNIAEYRARFGDELIDKIAALCDARRAQSGQQP
jgi:hypothetical protein